jgi:methyl-accepting chemotaxis protein
MRTLRGNLGDAVHETRTGRAILLPGGDEVSAKAAKLGIAARPSHDAEVTAGIADIESKILLARIASWRFLALHDNKGASSFKTSVDNAQQKLAALESATLPAEVQSAVASVKTSLTTYKNAFDTTSAAMLKADDIYGNNISPLIARSIDKLKAAETGLKSEYRASRATAEAAIASTTSIQQTVGVVAILFGCIVAYLIARSIAGPLASMTRAMGLLASGDLAIEIPGRGNRDEIGDMAKAIQVFKDNMVETERLRTEQKEIEARQAEQRKADMVGLADKFEQAVGEIVDAVSSASGELEASAGTLTTTASRGQDLSTEVAAASQEASANVQAVASATEELSSSVSEIARQVQESARIANEAVAQAGRTNERVGELSKAAARIGDVVELISTIAGQTNLLALNATI